MIINPACCGDMHSAHRQLLGLPVLRAHSLPGNLKIQKLRTFDNQSHYEISSNSRKKSQSHPIIYAKSTWWMQSLKFQKYITLLTELLTAVNMTEDSKEIMWITIQYFLNLLSKDNV